MSETVYFSCCTWYDVFVGSNPTGGSRRLLCAIIWISTKVVNTSGTRTEVGAAATCGIWFACFTAINQDLLAYVRGYHMRSIVKPSLQSTDLMCAVVWSWFKSASSLDTASGKQVVFKEVFSKQILLGNWCCKAWWLEQNSEFDTQKLHVILEDDSIKLIHEWNCLLFLLYVI